MEIRGQGIVRAEIRTQPGANLARLEDFGWLIRGAEPNLFFFFFSPSDRAIGDRFEMDLGEYLPWILEHLESVVSASFECTR